MVSLAKPRDISSKDNASSFHFLDNSSTSPTFSRLAITPLTGVKLEQPTEAARLTLDRQTNIVFTGAQAKGVSQGCKQGLK